MELADPLLFRELAYVDGRRRTSADGKTIDVENPANGQTLGSVPSLNASDISDAITAAKSAFNSWRRLTGKSRGEILRCWHGLISENADDLARLLTPREREALGRGEGRDSLRTVVRGLVRRGGAPHLRRCTPGHSSGSTSLRTAATDWCLWSNYCLEFSKCAHHAEDSSCFGSGCTVVVKPSELTPFSALALAELADRAGASRRAFSTSLLATQRPSGRGYAST